MIDLRYIALGPPRIRRILRVLALVMLAAIIAFMGFVAYMGLSRASPLQMPTPTGPYPVGRTQFDWIDAARRPDPLADQGDAPRELVVWVWYPAAEHGTVPAPYLPAAWARARTQAQGIGIFVEHNPSRILSNAYEGIPLAVAPITFPVLVMEPGLGPMATDYTALAENLASHGYVVVGINPTYSANLTVFPDGRVVTASAKGSLPEDESPAAIDADHNRLAAVWAQDDVFVIDQLTALNADPTSLFAGRLDLNRIGVWGHSLGGTAAGVVCRQDSRCKAGVNIDGKPASRVLETSLQRPFMFLAEDYSKRCDQACEEMHQVILKTESEDTYLVAIAGTRHFDFSDLPYRWLPPLRPLFIVAGYEGTIRPRRALKVTNAYLLAFFDQTLKGKSSALLDGPASAYPEVKIERP